LVRGANDPDRGSSGEALDELKALESELVLLNLSGGPEPDSSSSINLSFSACNFFSFSLSSWFFLA
jgi:hypothetical protein